MSKIKEKEKIELTNEEVLEDKIQNEEEKLEQEIEVKENEENKVDKDLEKIEENNEENRESTVKILEDKLDNEQGTKKVKKDGLHRYTIAITVISILLFIGLVVFSTIFGLLNRNSDKIVSGITIKGIEVSGLTYDEAKEKVQKIYNEKTKQNIVLKYNDFETSLTPDQIEMKFGIDEALDMAYSIGRSGKLLKDNYAIINAQIFKIDINPSLSYNEKILEDFIESTSLNLPDAVKESTYTINGSNLIITKGKAGSVIKVEELETNIINSMTDINQKAIEIQIPTVVKEPDAIDIEKIRNEIYKEPQDAYYTSNPFAVYPHVNGIDFAINNDEAKNLLNSESNEITIPLKITTPNVTTNQIGVEAFPNLLASYSTTFSTKNTNRTTNIKLSSNKINGVVLMPGEEFSYNTVVGQRTAAAGYKTAAVYVAGKVENGIGGGICQVSSTLYNTALRANLEIVKRSNHRFATGYVPLSTDATVSWGGPEFIFKNSRKYPIKIVSTVNGGRIKVDIYGCKEEVEYDVVIQSQTLQVIPMKTEYKTNTSLPKGTTKTVQTGHAGYKSRAYRILKLNGKVVSKQLLSTDTYAQLPTIIEQNN